MDLSQGVDFVETYLNSLVTQVEAIRFFPRARDRYPFDTIASSMMSKGLALSRSSIALVRAGFADEAYGLSRSLVEASLILRYITAVPSEQSKRSLAFILFSYSYKNIWLDMVRKAYAGTAESTKIESYAKRWRLTGDPREATQHWSQLRGFTWGAQKLTHPLDDPSLNATFKQGQYAVDYTALCQWVHCSQPALDNYVPDEGAPFHFAKSAGKFGNPGQSVLFIILQYMYFIVSYSLFGMGLDRPDTLKTTFSEALTKLAT